MEAAFFSITSEEQVQALLYGLVASLPADQNPYAAITAFLPAGLINYSTPSLKPILLTSSVVAALDILVYIAVWIVRWRRGTYWLFRIARAGGQPYLLFHLSHAWTLLATVMLVVMEGYIWVLYRTVEGALLDNMMLWITLAWLPGVVAQTVTTWTLATMYLVHRQTYSTGQRSRTSWIYSRCTVPVLFCTSMVAYIVSICYFSVVCNRSYTEMVANYNYLTTILAQASAAWSGQVDYSSLDGVASLLFVLVNQAPGLVQSYNRVFFIHGAFAIAVELILVVVACAYVVSLRRSLREFKGSPTALATFSRALRSLMITSVGFVVVTTIIAVDAIWAAAVFTAVFDGGTIAVMAAIVPTLTLVLGCLGVALILLYQTFLSPPTPSPSGSTSGHGSPDPSRLHRLSQHLPFAFNSFKTRAPRPIAVASPYSRPFAVFAVAAEEYDPHVAFGHLARGHSEAIAVSPSDGAPRPFEDLELQPSSPSSAVDLGVDGPGKLESASGHSTPARGLRGVAVSKQLEVTVVELGKVSGWGEPAIEFEDEEKKPGEARGPTESRGSLGDEQ
ncbi:hypothetical protein JCM10207_000599 [Rhodosporidiobolus poonsookiae]